MKSQFIVTCFIVVMMLFSAFSAQASLMPYEPDFIVSKITTPTSESGNDNPNAITNEYDIAIGVEITNRGTADSGKYAVNVFVINSAGERQVASQVYEVNFQASSSIVYTYPINKNFLTLGKNTIKVEVHDGTSHIDGSQIYPESNVSDNTSTAIIYVNDPSRPLADLIVSNINLPEKLALGSDLIVTATIKDLNKSSLKAYSILTTISDSHNVTTSQENDFSSDFLGNDIKHTILVKHSKLKLGINAVKITVIDKSKSEVNLDNNSISKTINIVAPTSSTRSVPFANGSLLRAKVSGKIFLVKNKAKYYISSLQELKKYKKSKIYIVDDATLDSYTNYSSKPYGDGVILISKTTSRVYLIKNQMKYYISTLSELSKYRKNKTYRVDESVINLYPDFK